MHYFFFSSYTSIKLHLQLLIHFSFRSWALYLDLTPTLSTFTLVRGGLWAFITFIRRAENLNALAHRLAWLPSMRLPLRAVEWATSSFLQQRPWTLGLGRLDLLQQVSNLIPIAFHSIHLQK